MTIKSALTAIALVAMVLKASPALSAQPATRPSTAPARSARIVLVGDSTVTDKAGWGPGLKALLADTGECLNLSLGGRSSKSYRNEGHWDKVLAARGDYVLLQFGHNDQPGKGLERETTPEEYRENMKRYVAEARAAGAKPVLVTPLVRREFKDGVEIRSSLAQHALIVKQVAADLDVPLIDLHDRSLSVCNAIGKEACIALLSTTKPDGSFDGTHLTPAGSMLFGAVVATELRRAVPEIAPHLRPVPLSSVTPTTAPATPTATLSRREKGPEGEAGFKTKTSSTPASAGPR